jgi:hypothetical protein
MTSKRKNLLIIFTISNKEINLIYPSVRYDQMNQSTVPALTTALVWSDMHGVMLARTHAVSNCKSGLKLQNHS